jgi:hypothetical protein
MGSPEIYDFAEPIKAYRWWGYYPKYPYLTSRETFWRPGEPMVARCRGCYSTFVERQQEMMKNPSCTAPMPSNFFSGSPHALPSAAQNVFLGCGFYGFKALERAYFDRPSTYNILGIVELGGKIFEHKRGFRAEKARIVALYDVDARVDPLLGGYLGLTHILTIDHESRVALAKRYEVPLLTFPYGSEVEESSL